MDIGLIKKLTRLANNNPNENEANLAARKVCKLLEEGNWELETKFTMRGSNPSWEPYKPHPAQEDFFNQSKSKPRETVKRPEPPKGRTPDYNFYDEVKNSDIFEQYFKDKGRKKVNPDIKEEEWIYDPIRYTRRNNITGEIISELEFQFRKFK